MTVINQHKLCSRCKTPKYLSLFYICKRNKDGFRNECIDCKKKEKILNLDRYKEYYKEYYIKNKDTIRTRLKKYYKDNRVAILYSVKEYQEKNRDRIRDYHKSYFQEYYSKNKDEIRKKYKSWFNFSYKFNTKMRLKTILVNRFKRLFRNSRTSKEFFDLQGCDMYDLKLWLEANFLPGMSWENYGCKFNQWSIDHIIPLSKFNLEDLEQRKKAFHYTNIQPLWHIDNLKKSNKI